MPVINFIKATNVDGDRDKVLYLNINQVLHFEPLGEGFYDVTFVRHFDSCHQPSKIRCNLLLNEEV